MEPVDAYKARRRGPRRQPHKVLYIACEGGVTEPRYLRSFERPGVNIKPAAGGDPATVVAAASKAAKKAKDDRAPFDEVWVVFDDDQRPGVADAITAADKAKLKVAYSNPCFEIWYLQHCRYSMEWQRTDEAIAELRKYIPRYDKDSDVYNLLLPKQADALANAPRLREEHRANRKKTTDNPSTTVDILVKRLNDLKRR